MPNGDDSALNSATGDLNNLLSLAIFAIARSWLFLNLLHTKTTTTMTTATATTQREDALRVLDLPCPSQTPVIEKSMILPSPVKEVYNQIGNANTDRACPPQHRQHH